jgi:hypothetical protein
MTIVTKLDTRKLDQLIAQAPTRASQIVRAGAFAVEGEAKTRAPVDTTALQNSIQAEERSGPLRWWAHDGVEYGIYQELGFHHWISGAFIQNPFMVPAVEHIRPQWNKMWRDLLR